MSCLGLVEARGDEGSSVFQSRDSYREKKREGEGEAGSLCSSTNILQCGMESCSAIACNASAGLCESTVLVGGDSPLG